MKKEKPARRVAVDMRAANLLWPRGSAQVYHSRVPLWGQPWSWSRVWIAGARRHNTVPALVVRGAAMAAAQAALLAACAVQGAALGLLIVGAFPW